MKFLLTASRSAVTTSVEAAWMNSVLGQTQLANSKSRRPTIQQSTARPEVESPTSATSPERTIFKGRFLNTTRTQFLTLPEFWQTRLVLPKTMRRRTISVVQSGAQSEEITPFSFSITKETVSEALRSPEP